VGSLNFISLYKTQSHYLNKYDFELKEFQERQTRVRAEMEVMGIKEEVLQLNDELIQLRRDFHQHPEIDTRN
jgi:hypothetical protein